MVVPEHRLEDKQLRKPRLHIRWLGSLGTSTLSTNHTSVAATAAIFQRMTHSSVLDLAASCSMHSILVLTMSDVRQEHCSCQVPVEHTMVHDVELKCLPHSLSILS